jgi:hypothetical protein
MGVAALVAAALSVVAAAVIGLDDGATLVPPPEAVAEGHLRALVAGRYEQALPYLVPERRDGGVNELRRLHEQLEREVGPVRDVRGEAGGRAGASAWAVARLRGERGEVSRRFELSRRHGEWRLLTLGGRP